MTQPADSSLLPNIYHFIARLDPFDNLPEALVKKIAENIVICYLAKSEFIAPEQLAEGSLYIIRRGAIEQLEIDGKLRTRFDEGDVFGYTMMQGQSGQSTQAFQAKALEGTLLYRLPTNKLNEFNADPIFAAHFAAQPQTRLKSALVASPQVNSLLLQSVQQCCPSEFVQVNSACPIQQVAQHMAAQRSTSAVVIDDNQLVGFISDRNITKRVVATGIDVGQPVSAVMTQNPSTIASNEIVLEAISKMMQFNIGHLPVMDGDRVVGVINASDLVQRHGARAVFLIDAIQRQDSVDKLLALMPQRQAVFEALVEAGIRPHLVSQVTTMIADALTIRLIALAEAALDAEGAGKPPCAYAWMAAGSQARYEMQLISDQDNAIVLSNDATDSDIAYFHRLADFVCRALDACGYETCPGDIMATNRRWCQPVAVWEAYYSEWIANPDPKALLSIGVFLDIRCVCGDTQLVQQLRQHMSELVTGNQRFISRLVANTLRVSPPIGFFRTFVLVKNGDNKNTLNIKKRAMNPVIDLARIYGLVAASEGASTFKRLQVAVEKEVLNKASYDDLMEAYNFICTVRLQHQLKAIRENRTINNHLPPDTLSRFERNHLKDAFRVIAAAQEVASLRYSAKGMLR